MSSCEGGSQSFDSKRPVGRLGQARLLAGCVTAIVGLCCNAFAQAACSDAPVEYQSRGYRVNRIRITNPFSFFQAEKAEMDWLKAGLPLREGQVFSNARYNNGVKFISEKLRSGIPLSGQRFRLIVVTAKLLSCNSASTPPTLDVEYHVLTTDYHAYSSHLFEVKKARAEEPATSAAVENTEGRFLFKPIADYNATTHAAGGFKSSVQLPNQLGAIGADFEQSSSSIRGDAEYQGDASTPYPLVNHLTWRVDYSYYKLPAGAVDISQGRVILQATGASKPLGSNGFILRYGVSLEGGNQQTTPLAAGQNTEHTTPGSGYGALKSYVGVSAPLTSHQSLAASYGVEFGSANSSPQLDFTKHLVNLSYLGRLHPKPSADNSFHRMLTIEAELAGGFIQHSKDVPTPERFFGGDNTQFFMPGDAWTIRDGPFIRSIPENNLNGAQSGLLGGASFYSISTTWSVPIWGRALIPKEVTQNGEFRKNLQFAEGTALSALTLFYETNSPGLQSALGQTQSLLNTLDTLSQQLSAIKAQNPTNQSLIAQIENAQGDADFLARSLKNAQTQKGIGLDQDVADNQVSPLASVLQDLDSVIPAVSPNDPELTTTRSALVSAQDSILEDLKSINPKVAADKARKQLNLVTPVINELVDEINLFSVSPVLAVDAARIWPDRFGTRFGIGGGVRFSLVNFNVTLGYSFNPSPHAGEGRGAFFFSMNVADLFFNSLKGN